MGTNLSVANERESTPDPWWQNSPTTSANVTASINPKSTDICSEEQRHRDELAVAVAAAVASSAGVPTMTTLLNDKNDDEQDDQEQEDGTIFENDSRHEQNQKKLEIFKKELATKREARQKAITALTDKIKRLQQQVKTEEKSRQHAENEVTRLKELLAEGGLKDELEKEKCKVKNLEVQLENERRLRIELEKQKEDAQEKEQQIRSLKEVASIGKEMLRIRELQVNELKKKLCETQYPEDLREEYEAQIQNVRRLKTLYEERAEAVRLEHQREIEREIARIQVLESKITELEHERKEAEVMREHLKDRVLKLDQELEDRNDAAMSLQEQLDASVIECRDLASQMKLINNLFSKMLVGNLNLDRITRLVEENQSLVIDLTSDDKKNDLAALLIDIAKQLDDDNSVIDSTETQHDNEEQQTNIVVNNNRTMTQQELALNLSKVWRILVQLLTQDQRSSTPPVSECDSENCYKSVETPSGKRSVISVSQTYLTLKNLILEKNSLIKEVNKLKLLNEHLETRLGSQEKRLSTVSTELKKTWGVVSKLRVQHKQLHTQEKILKYELQHKRILLNDLKDELERCKEIWDMARQKNCQSEEEWRKLRKEFADRRKNTDINNSAESGYEDDESNTPPTEESTDEQELDRLIDPENDSGLLMNEDLSTNTFIENIDNDHPNNQQNDTEYTPELLDNKTRVQDELVKIDEPGSSTMKENNSIEIKTVEENEKCKDITRNFSTHEDEPRRSTTEENNSIEVKSLEEKEESEDLTRNLKTHEPETIECDEENFIIKDTTPSESEVTSLTVPNTSAENISRFLEGLLASDDTTEGNTIISTEKLDVENDILDEASTKINADCSQIESNPDINEICTKSKNVGVESSNSEQLSNVESYSLPISPTCTDDFEIEKFNLPVLTDESTSRVLKTENKTEDTNVENNQTNFTRIPNGNDCQTDEDFGKLDEACGYTPSPSSSQATSIDLPTVNEVLGRLYNTTSTMEEQTSSLTSTNQIDKKPNENRTTEEVLDARTERLKRLEEQCKSLFNKVTATTIKSNVLSSKLELLHEQYGRSNENFDENTSSTTTTTNIRQTDKNDEEKHIDDTKNGNDR